MTKTTKQLKKDKAIMTVRQLRKLLEPYDSDDLFVMVASSPKFDQPVRPALGLITRGSFKWLNEKNPLAHGCTLDKPEPKADNCLVIHPA